VSDPYAVRCACSHWWADHNEDDSCALCGCDWFMAEGVSITEEES
jgi:hypothetical protein